MRILLISLLILSFFITACSNKNAIRDIDYDLEFEKGKTALAKKKFIKAQSHFNTVVIGASHTELGDDALFFLGEAHFYAKKEELLAIAEYDRLIRRMPFSTYVNVLDIEFVKLMFECLQNIIEIKHIVKKHWKNFKNILMIIPTQTIEFKHKKTF